MQEFLDTIIKWATTTGVKIIIGVVIGALILAGLYALFNNVVIPNMTTKVTNMFSYTGA